MTYFKYLWICKKHWFGLFIFFFVLGLLGGSKYNTLELAGMTLLFSWFVLTLVMLFSIKNKPKKK